MPDLAHAEVIALPGQSAETYRRHIPVANVPGGNAQAVAEYGLTVMGMLTRRIHEMDQALRLHGWGEVRKRNVGTVNLAGQTVGIVGVGQVGDVSRVCAMRAWTWWCSATGHDGAICPSTCGRSIWKPCSAKAISSS